MTMVADRIQLRLIELNKSERQASLEAGLDSTTVNSIIKGVKSLNPRVDTVKKLTGPLKCSLAYLLGEDDSPVPDRKPPEVVAWEVFKFYTNERVPESILADLKAAGLKIVDDDES